MLWVPKIDSKSNETMKHCHGRRRSFWLNMGPVLRAAVLTQSTPPRHPWTHVHGTWHDSRHRWSAHPQKISCRSDDGKAPIRTDVPSENLQVTKTSFRPRFLLPTENWFNIEWKNETVMAAIGHFDVQLCTIAFANFRYIDSRYNSNVGQSGQLKYQV